MALPPALESAVLTASSVDSVIQAWDVGTGTQLKSFKTTATPRNGMCAIGREHLVTAQLGKGSLHFWSLQKEGMLHRSFTSEGISVVRASHDGHLCVAGGVSGMIYVWEVASGKLLYSWAAHYKKVTAVAFTDDDSLLLTASEDTVVSTWSLLALLDVYKPDVAPPTPMYSWSEHTLPVVGLHSGAGGSTAMVATCSLDRTVKLWTLAGGELLRTVVFPTMTNAVAVDPIETLVCAGGWDGRIYLSPLNTPVSTSDRPSLPDASTHDRVFSGHKQAVTCLAFTLDGLTLISGSEDHTTRIWELRSGQALRVLNQSKGPVTSLIVIAKRDLGLDGTTAGPLARKQVESPLGHFSKYLASGPNDVTSGKGDQNGGVAGTLCVIPACADGTPNMISTVGGGGGEALHSLLSSKRPREVEGSSNPKAEETADDDAREEVARLKEELALAKAEAAKYKRMHAELHKFVVEEVVE
eukprot:1181684-Prorocentrum_minimum.AAC.4